jgi:hypothetical protein
MERARWDCARSTCIFGASSRLKRRRKEEIETLPIQILAICACLVMMKMGMLYVRAVTEARLLHTNEESRAKQM